MYKVGCAPFTLEIFIAMREKLHHRNCAKCEIVNTGLYLSLAAAQSSYFHSEFIESQFTCHQLQMLSQVSPISREGQSQSH